MHVELNAGIGAMIVRVAGLRGVDPAQLQRATGFDPALAADPDARISLALETQLWQAAAALSGDDAFGLHAGELVRPGVFDVLDYAVRTAPTLREALSRLVRYNRIVHDAAAFAFHEQGERVAIEHWFREPSAVQSRHSNEFTMVATLVIAREISGQPLSPCSVELRTAASSVPETLAEHERVFGLMPRFGAPIDRLEFARSMLDLPLPSADPALSRLVERHAEALLAARPDPAERTSQRVRRMLAELLGKEGATLGQIAERLHLSERSLQRRLAEEGLSFDAVLDDVRRDLALRYLAEPKLAIAEVAYLLGYSEPSPFHRAFKRWTGMTPNQARRPSTSPP